MACIQGCIDGRCRATIVGRPQHKPLSCQQTPSVSVSLNYFKRKEESVKKRTKNDIVIKKPKSLAHFYDKIIQKLDYPNAASPLHPQLSNDKIKKKITNNYISMTKQCQNDDKIITKL